MENKIILPEGCAELTLRSGEAIPAREPRVFKFKGDIRSVCNFISFNEIDPKKCVLIVNKSNLFMRLDIDYNSFFNNSIESEITLNPDFVKWGINTDILDSKELVSTTELADFIKMNRSCFKDPAEGMKLSSQLRQFVLKVKTEVEKYDDLRGSKKEAMEQQVIEINIPEIFTLQMPIIKNHEKVSFDVEVCISSNYQCYLISPMAKEYIDKESDTLILQEIEKIAEIYPTLSVIYQ